MEKSLKVIENDLVPVYKTSTGEKVVYGSELHLILGAKSNYREWVYRRIDDVDAVENEDFEGVEISTPSGQNKKDHIIKLDTAKEMAMLERNEKGKQVRRYFIAIEKKYHTPKKSQTKKRDLSATNMLVRNISGIFEKAGVNPIFIAAETKRLYKEQAGIDIELPLITDKEDMPKLYDCTEIARELGVISKTGRPHNQAVSAILCKITIQDSEIVTTAFTRNGHDDVTTQYKPSVLHKIKDWLTNNSYPTEIPYTDSKGNYKIYKVHYENAEEA